MAIVAKLWLQTRKTKSESQPHKTHGKRNTHTYTDTNPPVCIIASYSLFIRSLWLCVLFAMRNWLCVSHRTNVVRWRLDASACDCCALFFSLLSFSYKTTRRRKVEYIKVKRWVRTFHLHLIFENVQTVNIERASRAFVVAFNILNLQHRVLFNFVCSAHTLYVRLLRCMHPYQSVWGIIRRFKCRLFFCWLVFVHFHFVKSGEK